MEIGHNNFKRKLKSLDWEQLLPDDSDDDRPPELVIIPNNNNLNSDETRVHSQHNHIEHHSLVTKSDRDIADDIARLKTTLQTIAHKLPDKGEKIRANVRRQEMELERRRKIQSDKAAKGCEEAIQLSDHSDDGGSCGKKKSPSKFAYAFCEKMKENEDFRTVNAVQKDMSYIKPCQGPKMKLKRRALDNGRSKMGLSSSRTLKTSVVDSRKQITTDDDNKDGDFNTSVSKRNPPQDSPLRNLRPRPARAYNLVDEESSSPKLKEKSDTWTKPPQDSPSRNLRSRTARANHLVDVEPPSPKFMENLDPCLKDVKVYYPSRDDPDAVEVNFADMACLGPEACISSVIMNFYIRYLRQPSSSSENATSNCHFFNTYFYNKLDKLSHAEDAFLKFRKWWKGVTIFEKAYILLPVHESVHWSLLIICLPNNDDERGPILLHLDSLGLHNSMSLFDNVKRFLKEEWSYLRKTESPENLPVPNKIWENFDREVDCKSVMVPQQKNDYDCGLFVLFYIERFIEEAPERFRKKDISKFSRQWFRPQQASNLRAKIYDLLVEEFKKAKEESNS